MFPQCFLGPAKKVKAKSNQAWQGSPVQNSQPGEQVTKTRNSCSPEKVIHVVLKDSLRILALRLNRRVLALGVLLCNQI